MISTAEALSGPWALNVRGWLWTIVPTGGVVAAQELSMSLPSAGWVVASAVLQLVAVTAWSIAVVGLSRLRFGRVVPLASALLWAGGGVVHGVVGGALAAAAGAPPEWGYRIAFWVVATVIWMPLLTYALAQWAEHRRLLTRRAALDDEIVAATERATEDAGSRAERLTAAIDDAFAPALEEIRAQLRENGAGIEPAIAERVAAQLDDLARQTAEFAAIETVSVDTRPSRQVSVAEASVEFELRRPFFAALLTATVTAAPLLPESFREGGWAQAAEMLVAILVATVVLTGAFAVLRPLPLAGSTRSLLSRVGVLAAGLAGAATLLVLDWHAAPLGDVLLASLLVVIVGIGASVVATAVALEAANSELDAQVREDREALDELSHRLRDIDEKSSARLATLLQGELNGRLAASAMALAFLGSGSLPVEARDDVVAHVLAQLDAAAAELRIR